MAEKKQVYTLCQGWGCHEHCILSTFVDENGAIDYCERMFLPDEIENDKDPYRLGARARICAKGAVSGKIPYMKQRITHPLKRVGERGSGQWEEISWDQALDEIAAKIQGIVDEYGPRAVLLNDFPCGYAGYPAPLGYSMQYRFRHVFGFSQMEMEAADEVTIKTPGIVYGDDVRPNMTDTQRVSYSDYLIIWGGNPIGNTRAGHSTSAIMGLKEKGVPIVAITALYESTAAKADEALFVKPGSDGHLAMAMANHIIQSGAVDEDYIAKKTVAPFLVRDDNGKYLRESDIVEGGSETNYVYWDSAKGEPGFIAAAGAAASEEDAGRVDWTSSGSVFTAADDDAAGSTADLMAEVTVNGIPCKTAYALLVKQLEPCTFEYQEQFTNIPAEQAKRITDGFISHPDATIWLCAGLRYRNSVQAARVINLIPMLTGRLEKSEACGILMEGIYDTFPVQLADSAIIFQGYEPQFCHMEPMREILASFEDPNYEGQQFKAYINLYSNPVHNWPPRELWEKRFFPNLELVVVDEIRWTETCDFADYVLPDRTTFERPMMTIEGGYLVYCEPAIEPIGESRELGWVLMELGKRLGRPDAFGGTVEEWEERRLTWSTDPAITSVEPPITLERLKKEKIIKLNDPGRMFHCFKDASNGTLSGRMEFYVEQLTGVENGPLAAHTPTLIDDEERRKKYPLQLYAGRSRFFMQGQFREIAELRKLAGGGPRVGLNKHDAIERGIKEGDLVEIFNERGVVKVPCHFTNFIPRGMAQLWYAYGVEDYKMSGPATTLGANTGIDEAVDPVSEAWGPFWRQRRREIGYPETMMLNVGEYGTETLWDALCEVRRAE